MKLEEIEDLTKEIVNTYADNWNKGNPDKELKFNFTLSENKVKHPSTKKNVNIAYIRLERVVLDSDNTVLNKYIIYNDVYEFKSIKEKLDSKWKFKLYSKLLVSLATFGIEYAEIMHTFQKEQLKQKEEEKSKLDLEVTDKMPEPLTPEEEAYKKEIKAIRDADNS